ncbi:hypothetical protein ONS96_008954 [Cadophora gregata f. sp. sojae]|nr:hypothetical protein ONS96_008954 [Cadophora gregata f. sp. sojae]
MARPRHQETAPGQDKPVEVPKAANVTPEPEDYSTRGTHRSNHTQNHHNGSTRQIRTQTIRQPKVKIERSLWGRPKPEEPQNTLNANITREAEKLRGDARTRYEHMRPGPAPPGDEARRRAEGKMLTPQQYLQEMGRKRGNYYAKKEENARKEEEAKIAEEAKRAERAMKIEETRRVDEASRAEEVRETEEKEAAQRGDMLTVNYDDVEHVPSETIGQEETEVRNNNNVSVSTGVFHVSSIL